MHSNNIEYDHIVAISNPRSGRNKRGGFDKFTKTVSQFPEIKHVVTDSEATLLNTLEVCKKYQSKILIVNGGDGTLLHILTYLKLPENLRFTPRLVLLQAGTTSMAYGDVGCKGKLEAVLSKIVKYAEGSLSLLKDTPRAVLKMTLKEKNQIVCGMFFGGGVIYNGILYCRQNLHTKGMRGELGPSMAMVRYLFDWLTVNKLTSATRASVEIDNQAPIESEFTIITATTLNRLLMGVYPFWAKAQNDTGVALSLIKRNAPKATKAFLKILSGKAPNVEVQEDFYRSSRPSHVSLEIYDGFTLDGELFGKPGELSNVSLESGGDVIFLTA